MNIKSNTSFPNKPYCFSIRGVLYFSHQKLKEDALESAGGIWQVLDLPEFI